VPYKVYLVEDEVTTREGIRDNVDWQSAGFELCGEAPDGEIALPQIEVAQPDVLITDIKMPFMDGLQLCKIIREHMAWMKIIIISGYSDFQYAQAAIKLGATEYLLKPVSVNDLETILKKMAVSLDQEESERTYLKQLSRQMEDNLYHQREKFLLRLVTGGESSASAIEQSQELGLNILSPYYLVILFEIMPGAGIQHPGYEICQQVEKMIASTVGTNLDAILTKKGMDEFVLILKGESLDQLSQDSSFLTRLVSEEIESQTGCKLAVGVGTPQQRLGDLHRSFADALLNFEGVTSQSINGELKKLDHARLRQFLQEGQVEELGSFFDENILPLAEAAQQSNLLKHYIIIDIALAVAQFISDLGGNAEQIISARYDSDTELQRLKTLAQFRAEVEELLLNGMVFRDSQLENHRSTIIQRAKNYILEHFSDSNLSLTDVAAEVNFSPNHFSAVFSEETGSTFRDYLIGTRIEQAKKLLRNTRLKCAEVAYQCGYNDSHYFSLIFRKNAGVTPQQYREANRNHNL
jgi:two-component system response regulator YesN